MLKISNIFTNQHLQLSSVLVIVLALCSTAQAQSWFHSSIQPAQDERCFAETGYCMRGAIRAYWEKNGGLSVFGYPITEQHVETIEGTWTGPVQWFERDRLEDHTSDGQGVLAGRLGALILELRGLPWQTSFPPEQIPPPNCRFFPETSHSLCEPFLSYWINNGGLERFGYPITPPMSEAIGDWTGTVQYFERRRMEHHQENRGTPYEVLLGLLGNNVHKMQAEPPVGQIPLHYATAVAVQGAYAYVGSQDSLFVVDISNPARPVVQGQSLQLSGAVLDIDIQNDLAYVAAGSGGLYIFNISTLSSPRKVGTFTDFQSQGYATAVRGVNTYAYVTADDGFYILDVSDPTAPAQRGFSAINRGGNDVEVAGNYAFVAAQFSGLRLFDISDPSNPLRVGDYRANELVYTVAVLGNYAYLGGGGTLHIIDISDQVNPHATTTYYTQSSGASYSVAIQDTYVSIALLGQGLMLVDVSNPANPMQAGSYGVPGSAQDVAVADGYAYLAAGEGGLHILSISDPGNIHEVGAVR